MISVLLLFLATAHALPTGAPPSVCETMLPNHGGIAAQTDSSHFDVSIRRNGAGYMVMVKSSINVPFQGFILQARDPGRQLIGSFEPTTDLYHTIDCKGSGNTLTHSNTQQKPVVQVQWNPNGYEGQIIFNATVVQNYSTFWTGIESQQVQVSGEKQESTTDLDPFYDGCNEKKSCLGSPAGCVSSKNCKVVVAITVQGGSFEFELKAHKSATWAGVGLSQDAQMGDDSVIECVKDGSDVKAYMSYTSPRPNLGVSRDSQQDGIQLLESTVKDGALYCRVRRDAKTTVQGLVFDLTIDKYHLLVAAGSRASADKVQYHDVAYLPSEEKKMLSDVSVIKRRVPMKVVLK